MRNFIMNRLIQLKMFKTFIVLASPLVWYGLSSTSQAASPTNTSLGLESLPGNTTGTLDTGLGYQALKSNTVGNGNTATGARALGTNTAGNNNTATGWQALEFNSNGASNTAIGGSTLRFNTGDSNTGTGHDALQSNGAGTRNTATGDSALLRNSTGSPTQGSGLSLSLATKRATITRLVVTWRSLTTLVPTTSHWAQTRVRISPRALTISISATRV
jgi:hypothetical protein